MIIIALFSVVVVLELLVYIFGHWPVVRTGLAVCVAILGVGASALLIVKWPDIFSLTILLLSLYKAINMKRIVKHRMHEAYMLTATRRTSFILTCLQLIVIALWIAWGKWHASGHDVWVSVATAQLIVALTLLVSTIGNLRRSFWTTSKINYTDSELPSITVAIPARNETEDLQECLLSIISSDYPKLEILVLDDCSQTRHTPDIIREFAQDGVRFIQGREPDLYWLPKNQAYARLASEASGTYIVFCGVDIRFKPSSIRSLVTKVLEDKKQMISILPLKHKEVSKRSSIIQAIRYCWELTLPRTMVKRPPVLSSCWIVEAKSLQHAGGFDSVTRAIVPESYFARYFSKKAAYSFMRSNLNLGIESNKDLVAQRETAIRMRYPQLHKRPEHVAIASILLLLFGILPPVIFVAGFWISIGSVAQLVALFAFILLVVTYELVVSSTRVNNLWVGLFAEPFAAITDILLLNYSMWRYEFATVDWKGRDIEAPVMHAAKRFQTS